jgi:hypothetical protein
LLRGVDLAVLTSGEFKVVQLIRITAKHHVIGNAQDLLVHGPFSGGLVREALGLSEVLPLCARGEQLDYHIRGRFFLPDHITEAQIPALIQPRDPQGGKPIRAFIPRRPAHGIVEVQVTGDKDAIRRIPGRLKRLAQQVRLVVMELIGQARLLWILTGQIVHRR